MSDYKKSKSWSNGQSSRPKYSHSRQEKPMIHAEKYKFYIDEDKKQIDSSLLSEKAEQFAKAFGQSRDSSKTQIRRFYDEFKRLEQRSKDSSFEVVEPHLRMIKARACYASKRQSSKIPADLKTFLENLVNSINSDNDLKAAALLFEAVVGYAQVYVQKK